MKTPEDLKRKALGKVRRKAKRALAARSKRNNKDGLKLQFNMGEHLALFAAYRELGPPLKLGQVISVPMLRKFIKARLFAGIKAKEGSGLPNLVKVKSALQGAHMDLEELQQDAESQLRDWIDLHGELSVKRSEYAKALELSIAGMEEAAANVYKATEVLDTITPEGT